MSQKLNILLVEDTAGDAAIIEFYLAEQFADSYNFFHVEKFNDCLHELKIKKYDVVLLDLDLPDSQGIQTIKTLMTTYPEQLVIVLTGLNDEKTGLETVQKGANDYMVKVKIRMVDYPNQIPFETVLLMDTLTSESPSLTYEESNRLYQEVMKDYEGETKYKMFQKVKENDYFNALQVKFSYAITCHKSQGGQWNTVFIEQPYLPNGIDRDYIRWLYTAITRAKDKLYLIGFKDENFEE